MARKTEDLLKTYKLQLIWFKNNQITSVNNRVIKKKDVSKSEIKDLENKISILEKTINNIPKQ